LPDGEQPEISADEDSPGEGDETTAQGTSASSRTPTEVEYTAKQAMRTRAFWQLVLAMGGGQLIMSATVHQIPALTSFGVSRTMAGMVILAISIVSLLGRLASGVVGDKWDKRHVIAAAFLLQFVGTLFFAYTSNNWHLAGFVVFWGIGFGASIPIRFSMLADYFGRRHFGTIMGIMMTFSTVFGVIGPIFVGWMFDVRGNYREPYLILAASIVFTIPLILTLNQPGQPGQNRLPVRR
ncbi:MAG: MFS transporter, partial [SAR202 cluster bacterium]|nr:MFS transporter [SAR202 cluster bacterium]